MHEEIHAGEWLVTTLESDTGAGGLFDPAGAEVPSGVYKDPIPLDRELPAIRFFPLTMHDVRGATAPTARIMVQIDWVVAYVRKGHGIAAALPKVDRIDTLLHDANGETSTLRVYTCIRIEPFDLVEPDDSGVQYRHLGGVYRTIVQAK